MTLGEKRRLFTSLAARLVLHAETLGLALALAEAKRTDEQAEINAMGEAGREALALHVKKLWPRLANAIINNGAANGIRNSLHGDGLAADFDLYRVAAPGIPGSYLDKTEDHRPLGEWWEAQHQLCRWGGRFGDGNHYSLEHEGRK